MSQCTTVTVQGPSINKPTVSSINTDAQTNRVDASVTWSNPNDSSVTFDSVMTVDGKEKSETVTISGKGSRTVDYTASFDIPAGESRDKEVCVEATNVRA